MLDIAYCGMLEFIWFYAMKTISILGSTGSIGISTLKVLKLHKDHFDVFGLSCNKNIDLLARQAIEFNPRYLVCSSHLDAKKLKANLPSQVKSKILFSNDSLNFIASHNNVTHVVASISGSAGLESTYNAAKSNKVILLANKESMIMAGPLIMKLIKNGKSKIIPIDSEHNAIHQVLQGNSNRKNFLKKIILTASGGPFINTSVRNLKNVSVEDALNHPNWSMGKKVTIDSATMMNKGLEVIEASYLFNLSARQIEVLIHPQSIIHSLVEFNDGSLLTQIGKPDMRIPISYALGFPDRINSGVEGLNLSEHKLTFIKPNLNKFPCLKLAFMALDLGHSYCVALNSSNELAVDAFLNKKINFLDIFRINSEILSKAKTFNLKTLSDIKSYDLEIKKITSELLCNKKIINTQ